METNTITKNINIEFNNQWIQFIPKKDRKWNWFTFDLVEIEVENEEWIGQFNIDVTLLGFGIHIGIHYKDTKLSKELEEDERRINGCIFFPVKEGYRQGQAIFDFLEWLKTKGYDGNQNARMADPFNIEDEELEKLMKEYEELS